MCCDRFVTMHLYFELNLYKVLLWMVKIKV